MSHPSGSKPRCPQGIPKSRTAASSLPAQQGSSGRLSISTDRLYRVAVGQGGSGNQRGA